MHDAHGISSRRGLGRLLHCHVPTPLKDHEPDLGYIRTAGEGIARHLRPGMLVILEPTTYPGTTEEVLRPILEASGLTTGRDFTLATEFYRAFVHEVHVVSSPREAEMSKLSENAYRHVNIALVNELALFSRDLDVDIWEAIRAAATKPLGFMPFWPGRGVGGHCIAIGPSPASRGGSGS